MSAHSRAAFVALFFAALAAGAETLPSLPHASDLYVSGFFTASIHRYHGPRSATVGPHPAPGRGEAVYAPGVLRRPWGIAFGPDGNLYVANASGTQPGIARVDGPFSQTPGAVHELVPAALFYDLAFGPDGHLYAGGRGAIRRYDVTDGRLIDEFTRGHELGEVRGIAFGPDGYLYVSNSIDSSRGEIVRFDAFSGHFFDVYVRSGEGGLGSPWKIAFSARGDLLVVNWTPNGNNILRYPGGLNRLLRLLTRSRSALFIAREGWLPLYIATGPDGNLYVSDGDASGAAGAVRRFDGRTGAFIDAFVPDVPGGPRGIAFLPGAR